MEFFIFEEGETMEYLMRATPRKQICSGHHLYIRTYIYKLQAHNLTSIERYYHD